jgi:hypothetical protein
MLRRLCSETSEILSEQVLNDRAALEWISERLEHPALPPSRRQGLLVLHQERIQRLADCLRALLAGEGLEQPGVNPLLGNQ